MAVHCHAGEYNKKKMEYKIMGVSKIKKMEYKIMLVSKIKNGM